MIASLPMYWRPETAAAWQGFWKDVQAAARAEGLDLPDLTPPEALPTRWTDHWRDPNLILSHSCSLPLRSILRDQVTYVGTLDFGLKCKPGHYYSRLITPFGPHDKRRGIDNITLAVNSRDSQSGWAVAQQATPFGRPPKIASIIETGSHTGSLAAVAEGRATLAYIDAVTWRLLKRFDAAAKRVFLAGRSVTTPGLPLITAKGRDPAPLRAALTASCTSSDWIGHPDLSSLKGFTVLDVADYHALPIPPDCLS